MTHCKLSLRAAVCVNVGRDRVWMMMMKYFRPDFLACQCSISACGNMSSEQKELPWSGCWQLDITHTKFHTDGHTAVRHNNKHDWDSPRERQRWEQNCKFSCAIADQTLELWKRNPPLSYCQSLSWTYTLGETYHTNKACSTSINPSLCRHDTHTHSLELESTFKEIILYTW